MFEEFGKVRMQLSGKSTLYRGGVAAASCSIPLSVPHRSDTDDSAYRDYHSDLPQRQ